MNAIVLATFIAYFIIVILVGAYFYDKKTGMNEYFLADRQMNPYVVAMSAQASDMSGWLLMGLPGAILMAGVGEVWIGIGLAIGTYFAWLIIAKRLRVYSEKADNAITVSEFFANRFEDNKALLRIVSGIVILVFFTFYVASGFVAGGGVLKAIFPDVDLSLLIVVGAAVVIVYTFLGGFNAVCWTDFLQGMLMLVAVVILPLALIGELGGAESAWDSIVSIAGVDSGFSLDMMSVGAITIVSGLAWGLGYFGMPHIMVRYMSIKNPDDIKKSRRVATVWVIIALTCACLIGLVGRAWAESAGIMGEGFNPEHIMIYAVDALWTVAVPVLAGVIFAALMAAIMSTADSQLLVAAGAVSNDIIKHHKKGEISDEKLVWISRAVVIVISVIALVIALGENKTIMNLVSFAWAGFGAAFGPLVLLALFWKRTNSKGAIAGIIVGFAVTILWNTFLGSGQIVDGLQITDAPLYGLYELLPGFILSALAVIVVSLITAKPSKEVVDTFEAVDAECNAVKPIGLAGTGIAAVVAAALFFIGLDFADHLTAWEFTETIGVMNIAGGLAGGCAFVGTAVAGVALAVAGYGLYANRSDRLMGGAGALTLLAGLCLLCAGVFDLGVSDFHFVVRDLALAFGGLALMCLVYRNVERKQYICAGACMMAGIVTVLSVIGGAACLTTAAAFGMMFCALVQGLKLMLAKEY